MKEYLSASNKIMIRIPFQDEKFKNKAIDISNNIDELKNNKVFCEQLLIASNSLYELLIKSEFNELTSKKRRNLIVAVASYINRSATRTTPFGLFSGVGLIDINNNQLNNLDKENNMFIKHTRIDIEWLMNFIKQIEKNHYSKLNFRLNGSIYIIGNRVFLPYNTDSRTDRVSINLTKPFKLLYSVFDQKKNLSFDNLIVCLQNEYPSREIEVFISYLLTLVENEFLISSLRPPLTNTDELDWVISKLSDNPDLLMYKELLVGLQEDILKYSKTEIGAGIDLYESILEKMKNINKIKSKSYLQVDCEIKTNASILIKEDIQELENFVSFLLKISKNKRNKYLEEFKLRFVEKYGEYIEIPIYEVLDETLGIGAPMNYMNPKNRYISSLENHVPADDLTDYFMKKYIEAIKMNTSISLSLKEITLYLNVNNEEQNDEILTKNLELNFLIKTVKKNKKFYLGTNIGSIKAGKSFGRFSYFSDSFLGFMKECDSQFKNISTEDVCELVYFPKDVRSGNVTRNSSSNIKNISLYTNSYDEKNEIKISSVLVGVEDNKLYLRNLADNKKIVVTSNNMLNPTISDNGIRLLQEISLQDELSWSNFAWSEIYAQFSYVPQIEFENIIIDTELWKINKYSLELTDTKVSIEKFESHFIKLQKKLQIPNIFYLQSADNRILIDFTNRVYIDLMYKKYKQFGEMILRGIEVGGNLNTIYSGKRPVEIVVPFFKTSKSEVKITKEIKINKSIHQDNKFNPFDEWIFYKIYCSNQNEEEIIKLISEFLEEISKDFPIFISYFMRYNDPFPHIRLRIKAEADHLFEITKRFNIFILPLQNLKLISKYLIDTYQPEFERYGGKDQMELVEKVFQIDSRVVTKLMVLDEEKEKKAVVSVLHYLNSFGITFENQLLLLEAVVGKDSFKLEFKDKKNEYVTNLDSYNNWYIFKKNPKNKELISLLDLRNIAIQGYLKSLFESKHLTNNFEDIILSVIHLHCNRLLGTDRLYEKKIYFFAWSTLKGQRYKRKMLIENETNT